MAEMVPTIQSFTSGLHDAVNIPVPQLVAESPGCRRRSCSRKGGRLSSSVVGGIRPDAAPSESELDDGPIADFATCCSRHFRVSCFFEWLSHQLWRCEAETIPQFSLRKLGAPVASPNSLKVYPRLKEQMHEDGDMHDYSCGHASCPWRLKATFLSLSLHFLLFLCELQAV